MSKPSSKMSWIGPPDDAFRPHQGQSSWNALEQFIQALQGGSRDLDAYDDVLSAIREGTEAHGTFLCNDQSGEVLGMAGDHLPSTRWCHQITSELVGKLPDGGLWRSPLDGSLEASAEPCVTSAILVPLKNPQSSWVMAVRLGEGPDFSANDLRVARVIWQLYTDHHGHKRVQDKLKETLFGVVRCLSAAIDAKDPYTCGHSERVARIAVRLGEEMGLHRGETSDLYLAGLLHDLGKIGIRDSVLCKEGPLTSDEYLHMQEHPVIGERIISNVTRLAYLRPGIRGHHERFDGSGYPDGLAGEAIPLMARILAVADACDAMMSVRRYRSALSQVKIAEIFREGAGTQWDPRIVGHFLDCRHELFAVIERGLGQSVYFAIERAVGGGETINGTAQPHFRKSPASFRGH